MQYPRILIILILQSLTSPIVSSEPVQDFFSRPDAQYQPETWFHLIGGNVNREALSVDLEAVAGAGFKGIQLFHGRGNEWPGVSPQIQTLSPSWDGMIAHVGRETDRLGLQFTMQNCPGWAMSGGPWITPDKAMRHLIWSRMDFKGGELVECLLPLPQPSEEEWRDFKDVAVLAFPTPLDDQADPLPPVAVRSNLPGQPWEALLSGETGEPVEIIPGGEPVWVEVEFAEPVSIRSLELPPTSHLAKRRIFDPDTTIILEAVTERGRVEVGRRDVPRGTWQDRQDEMVLSLAFPDSKASTYRISFVSPHPLQLEYLRLYSSARLNDWRGQAGYALRSLDYTGHPAQDCRTWIEPASIIDLSGQMDSSGGLRWNAPEGNWTVVRFGHVNTGIKNKPAPPEATGFECDKLSPAGAEQHFAGYIGRLTQEDGVLSGGRLDGMLIDSWECYTQTWTPALEREFENRRGYALRSWLPALAGWVVGDHKTSERFLRDWRATISDLLVDNYFGRLSELGRERGLKLSFETAVGDISPGDILQFYSKADIPMCEFWHPNDPHVGGFETKPIHPTVSAAHIYGKPVVAAEAFTNVWIRWDEHPWMLKHQADRHFALGVNHLIFHTYTHNPRLDLVPGTSFGSRIGTPFIRGQTWWRYMPLFTDYLARCHYLLQQGQPVADVLWYLGDAVDHKPRQDSPFPEGYRFDYLNADVLLNRLQVVDGRLRIPEGQEWKVIWLADEQCQRMTPATLARLKELIEAGATVIGGPPDSNPSLSGGKEAVASFDQLVHQLWGDNPEEGDRRHGLGRLVWGLSLQETLSDLGIEPDVTGIRPENWFHRRTVENEIYFITAGRSDPVRTNVRFRATGRPEFWNPLTGESTPVTVFHQTGQFTTIPVSLEAAGSVFVVFHQGKGDSVARRIEKDGQAALDPTDTSIADTSRPYPSYGLDIEDETQPWIQPAPPGVGFPDEEGRLVVWENGEYVIESESSGRQSHLVEGLTMRELDKDWTLAFPEGWDIPAQLTLSRLAPWSSLEDPAVRSFSGTVIYRTSFTVDEPSSRKPVLLDLGRVANIAEVRLNGHLLDTLWAPPFRSTITDCLVDGENHLEVRVTNTWRNRLAYDASLPEPERKTWTIHAPPPDAPIETAGLVGPVLLREGRVLTIH
ncbi:MAG: glycosyl hydrolase [Puniceicoccaceae bacterium]